MSLCWETLHSTRVRAHVAETTVYCTPKPTATEVWERTAFPPTLLPSFRRISPTLKAKECWKLGQKNEGVLVILFRTGLCQRYGIEAKGATYPFRFRPSSVLEVQAFERSPGTRAIEISVYTQLQLVPVGQAGRLLSLHILVFPSSIMWLKSPFEVRLRPSSIQTRQRPDLAKTVSGTRLLFQPYALLLGTRFDS